MFVHVHAAAEHEFDFFAAVSGKLCEALSYTKRELLERAALFGYLGVMNYSMVVYMKYL